MTNNEDECMDNLITAYSILTSTTGARIITPDGKDITDDIKKARPINGREYKDD